MYFATNFSAQWDEAVILLTKKSNLWDKSVFEFSKISTLWGKYNYFAQKFSAQSDKFFFTWPNFGTVRQKGTQFPKFPTLWDQDK